MARLWDIVLTRVTENYQDNPDLTAIRRAAAAVLSQQATFLWFTERGWIPFRQRGPWPNIYSTRFSNMKQDMKVEKITRIPVHLDT